LRSQPWATQDIPDLSGRLAVVTGANSGIGFETAKALAIAGADVVLATRSVEKGEAAAEAIRAVAPAATVVREALDLSDLGSVSAFAAARQVDGRPIDLLVNNAGIMSIPKRKVTVDGFEMQLGTNYLGHFALTGLLLDLLRAAPSPRVITLSSGVAHWPARIHFDDLQLERGYSPRRAYGQSKLATLLFALELDRRGSVHGWGILSAAAHPGASHTNLHSTGPRDGKTARLPGREMRLLRLTGNSQSAAKGALATLMAATAPDIDGGDYYGPSRRLELVGPPAPARVPRRGRDQATARRLWAVSEQLTGVVWPGTARKRKRELTPSRLSGDI
jgi:NAD(P)-dependent dehydrogenase (short-subunit alcohol dehydrogenase family)